jgi:hypothetical protein
MQLTDQSLVLVAIMPNVRDMEIARVLGWYRIPMKTAPKIVRTDLIAFYQPKAFGAEHQSRIEKYAEIRGVELVMRRELFRDEPDHPRAEEEYYKLQLGPLRELETPIPADRWKRFLFFYTTAEKLFSAKSMRDLAVVGAERDILWRSLQERANVSLSPAAAQSQTMDPRVDLQFLLGNLSLAGLDFDLPEDSLD